jgi:hypothetical protein
MFDQNIWYCPYIILLFVKIELNTLMRQYIPCYFILYVHIYYYNCFNFYHQASYTL